VPQALQPLPNFALAPTSGAMKSGGRLLWICAGTAYCPEITSFRERLCGLLAKNSLARHRHRMVGIVRS
jgi:hypothetical protein